MKDCLGSKTNIAKFLDVYPQNIQQYYVGERSLDDKRVSKCLRYLKKHYLSYEYFFEDTNPFVNKYFISISPLLDLSKDKPKDFLLRFKHLIAFVYPYRNLEKDFDIKLMAAIKKYWPYKESQSKEDNGVDEVATSSKQEEGKTGKMSD